MTRIVFFVLGCLLTVTGFGKAALAVSVFACEPEWAALAVEIGGNRVNAFSATSGAQDPHHITARPSLIARMRSADIAVCTGADLEAGWLPLLLRQASNPRVQPGMPGYFEAAQHVQMKEVPAMVDRRMGDVHAAGNPHLQADPRNLLTVGKALADRLSKIDPAGTAVYQTRFAAFQTRWQAAIQRWETAAAPLKGMPVLVQHKNMVYLLDWLGMREVAALEPIVGVEPTTTYLGEVLKAAAAAAPRMVLVAGYESDRPAQWVAGQAKMPAVVVPLTVGGVNGADTLEQTFDITIARLLAAASAR
jgi:zinc/manganese transport system substrate-binding protein